MRRLERDGPLGSYSVALELWQLDGRGRSGCEVRWSWYADGGLHTVSRLERDASEGWRAYLDARRRLAGGEHPAQLELGHEREPDTVEAAIQRAVRARNGGAPPRPS